jgi:hypothetical protein
MVQQKQKHDSPGKLPEAFEGLDGYGAFGNSLDSLYESFAASYCRECDSCEPQDADWKWTPE